MRCRLSCLPPESPRNLDQHDQHAEASEEEVAEDTDEVIHVANKDHAETHVSVHGGIGDKGKLTALDAPGDRCATGGYQAENPHCGALPMKDPGEQRPKENVRRDIQICAGEMRLQATLLKGKSRASR